MLTIDSTTLVLLTALISTGSADTTYTTLLAAGFQLQSNNNGGTGVLSFTTAGDASAAAILSALERNTRGEFRGQY